MVGYVRQRLPSLIISGLVALALGGGYLAYEWATHSPRFAISEFSLSGNEQLQEEDIRELLALPANANIFRTDVGSLETRLLKSPWIQSAEVSRQLPGGLEIKLEEEKAVAAAALGGLYLLNKEGKLFKRASIAEGELDGLSIITGIERDAHVQDTEHSQRQLREALHALMQFQKNTDRPRIGEVHLDEYQGMSFVTFEQAIAIHLGTPTREELADRFGAFDAAWHALDAQEHAAVRSFRISDRSPSDQVTVAFAGN